MQVRAENGEAYLCPNDLVNRRKALASKVAPVIKEP